MSLDSQGDGTSRGGASGQLHVFVFAFFFFLWGQCLVREQSLSFGEPAASTEGLLGSPWATAPLR